MRMEYRHRPRNSGIFRFRYEIWERKKTIFKKINELVRSKRMSLDLYLPPSDVDWELLLQASFSSALSSFRPITFEGHIWAFSRRFLNAVCIVFRARNRSFATQRFKKLGRRLIFWRLVDRQMCIENASWYILLTPTSSSSSLVF